MPAQKFPPPPYLAADDPKSQQLNRWLLELQSILNDQGGIDVSQIQGLPAVIAQVATNTADIATLEGSSGGQAAQIAVLQASVNSLTISVATINGQITTLSARNQVFNGTVPPVALHASGDYYVDTTAKHLYVQVSGAWVLIV